MRVFISNLLLTCTFLLASGASAAPKYPEAVIPDSVEVQKITIWSDGRALDGSIYRPGNLNQDAKVPAIVTSHGWGGDKRTAARYAVKFATAGFIAVTFTHSTWGGSQGNLLQSKVAEVKSGNTSTMPVHEVRKIIDPVDWTQNFRSAIDYLEGEPNVDPGKIGGWGTSFGGGIAAFNAAYDARVRSLVLQVPAFPSLSEPQQKHAKRRATDIARGNIAAIPEGQDSIPGLDGTPHFARFLQYQPMGSIELINIPTLFIAAAKEDLFNNEEHSEKAYNILKSKNNIPTEYYLIPEINHYGIYFDGYETGSELALDWFKKTLQ